MEAVNDPKLADAFSRISLANKRNSVLGTTKPDRDVEGFDLGYGKAQSFRVIPDRLSNVSSVAHSARPKVKGYHPPAY